MNSSTQTEPIQLSNVAVQSTCNRDVQVEAKAQEIASEDATLSQVWRSSPSLIKFLRSAERILREEIAVSVKECKELNYIFQSLRSNRIFEIQSNQVHSLYSDHLAGRGARGDESSDSHDFLVSSIEWNCSSSVIMIGYRVKQCDSYGNHESLICTWSLYRRYTRESQPSAILETKGCVTRIAGHPEHASIFTSATCSGHVAVIDFSLSGRDGSSISAGGKLYHEEGVSFLSWIPGTNILISASFDGNIIIWSYSMADASLSAMKRYSLLTIHLAKGVSKDPSVKSKVGISAGSVVSRGKSSCKLFLGCWGGSVSLCSVDWKECDPRVHSHNLIKCNDNPVSLSYVPHRSDISSVDTWKQNGLLVASSSLDGELRIYHINQSKPIALYHFESDVHKISWSIFHSIIYCAVKDSTSLCLINFNPAEEEENRLISETTSLAARSYSLTRQQFWLNRHSRRHEELAFVKDSGEIALLEVTID